jgi:hypothetical protein
VNAVDSNELQLKQQIARRAQELGDAVQPGEVTLEWMADEVAAQALLFRARWPAREGEACLAGVVLDGSADTYPLQALGKVFQRWIKTHGQLPGAARAAEVCAYLLDAASRHRPVLTEQDRAARVTQPQWLPYVGLPELTGSAERPQLAFWWVGPRGTSRVRVLVEADERIRIEEKPIQDFLLRPQP